MIVRLRLVGATGHARTLTLRRRDDWLPADVMQESHTTPEGHKHVNYRLDTKASDAGLLIYRETQERAA